MTGLENLVLNPAKCNYQERTCTNIEYSLESGSKYQLWPSKEDEKPTVKRHPFGSGATRAMNKS